MGERLSSERDQKNPDWRMKELDELGEKWGIGRFSNPIVSLEGLSAETPNPISSIPI